MLEIAFSDKMLWNHKDFPKRCAFFKLGVLRTTAIVIGTILLEECRNWLFALFDICKSHRCELFLLSTFKNTTIKQPEPPPTTSREKRSKNNPSTYLCWIQILLFHRALAFTVLSIRFVLNYLFFFIFRSFLSVFFLNFKNFLPRWPFFRIPTEALILFRLCFFFHAYQFWAELLSTWFFFQHFKGLAEFL